MKWKQLGRADEESCKFVTLKFTVRIKPFRIHRRHFGRLVYKCYVLLFSVSKVAKHLRWFKPIPKVYSTISYLNAEIDFLPTIFSCNVTVRIKTINSETITIFDLRDNKCRRSTPVPILKRDRFYAIQLSEERISFFQRKKLN